MIIFSYLLDFFSFSLSVIISLFFLHIPSVEYFSYVHLFIFSLSGIFFITSIYNYGGYSQDVEFSNLNQMTSLLKASILFISIIICITFIFDIKITNYFNRKSQISFTIALILIPIIIRQFFYSLLRPPIIKEKIIVIGAGEIGKAFVSNLDRSLNRFKIIGFIDDNISSSESICGIKILGNISNLKKICLDNKIDRLIIAFRNLSQDKLIAIESEASSINIKVNYLPSKESFIGNPGKFKELSGIPLLTRNFQKPTPFYFFIKRFFDLVLSIIALVLSSPLWIISILLIKTDSKGPVFFSQNRVGLNGKIFKIYKFRSMFVDSPKYANCPSDQKDPRVTKTGKWLRKTSIDELPQLINIIIGDMSIVGPRPEMEFIVKKYNLIERKRLLAKPGLTGLWQISSYRDSEINHNLEYDFYYLENQSFILDIVIMVMTVFFVTKGTTS